MVLDKDWLFLQPVGRNTVKNLFSQSHLVLIISVSVLYL